MTEEVNKLKWFLLVKDRFEQIKAEAVDKWTIWLKAIAIEVIIP